MVTPEQEEMSKEEKALAARLGKQLGRWFVDSPDAWLLGKKPRGLKDVGGGAVVASQRSRREEAPRKKVILVDTPSLDDSEGEYTGLSIADHY